ncbi:hypothetical protein ACNKF0_13630 [Nocardioides sp. T5]|uniref:hypothetical protein n=1 Tax=Nocardioides sp. T5 TaxID=3400182 RepID=UPI003A853673
MSSGLWDYRDSVWDYRESTWTLDADLVGYEVVASDGHLGTVVRASSSSAAAYLAVDAARAGAGLRLVPAGAVASMDHDDRTVRIDLTVVQVAAAPAYEEADGAVRAEHHDYFSTLDRC